MPSIQPNPHPTRLLPLLNAGRQRPKRGSRRGGPRNGHTGLPSPPLLPNPTQDRAETWSRVSGWMGAKPRTPAKPGTQGPACQGRASPKISKACLPPAARPAPCRGPGSGWTSPTGLEQRPFPRAPDFRSWPRSAHILLPGRQTPVPRPPPAPGLQERSSFPPPGPQLRCHRGRFPRPPPGF